MLKYFGGIEIFIQTRPRAGRVDRWEGTVLMGTLLTPRFAPTALSSEGNDSFVTNRKTDSYYCKSD